MLYGTVVLPPAIHACSGQIEHNLLKLNSASPNVSCLSGFDICYDLRRVRILEAGSMEQLLTYATHVANRSSTALGAPGAVEVR